VTVAHNSDEWRWADPQGQQRTIRADELRAALASGVIPPNAPVWKPGFREWQAANTVAELMTSALAAENGVLLNVPPPPLAIVAVQHAYEEEGETHGAGASHEEPPSPPAYIPLPPKSAPEVASPAPSPAPPVVAASAPAPAPPANVPAAPKRPEKSTKPAPLRTGTLIGFAPSGSVAAPLVQSELTDELSSSHLIPADSSSDVSMVPSEPLASRNDQSESVHLPFRPSRADQLNALVQRGKSVAQEKPKVAAIAGGAFVIAIFGIYLLARDSSPSSSTATVSSASVKSPAPPPPKGCNVLGASRAIAPHATAQVGLELVASGDRIGVGFAASPRKAITVAIDPITFDLVPKPTVESPRIAHVLPLPTGKGESRFSTIVDPEGAEDGLSMKRSFVAGDRIDVGVRGKSLVLSKNGPADYADFFALADGEGAVEALDAATMGDNEGVAVAFRRNSSIWLGIAQRDAGELKSTGLFRFAGSSAKVGSPSIATFGNEVLVAWAERVSPNAPWAIKTGRWGKEGLGAPKDVALPPGGKGEQGMSPSLVAIDRKRALLTWAEGPISSHEVRAQVISLESAPIGSAFSLSEPGVNAGQPQAALLRSGKGLAAFFVERGRDLQVSAVQIECALE